MFAQMKRRSATKAAEKHTEGPWAVHPDRAQVDAFATGVPEGICRLLWPTYVRSEAETEANAHLIAAAPELLAALKAMVASYDGVRDALTCRTVIDKLARADAAIAKAEANHHDA